MFNALKKIFEQLAIASEQTQPIEPELALAVLLYEVAHADMAIDNTEHDTIARILANAFSLSDSQVSALLIRAKTNQSESVSIQTFTSILTKHLDRQKRLEFIQAMWQVAYADGELDGHEEYIIRKISDLIYLNHSDYIKAKLNAQQPSERNN